MVNLDSLKGTEQEKRFISMEVIMKVNGLMIKNKARYVKNLILINNSYILDRIPIIKNPERENCLI